MFKKSKRSPPFPTVWLAGLAVNLGGLLLAVSSMDYAPITPMKLLIAALCLTGIAVSSRHLRYMPSASHHKAILSAHKQQNKQQPNVAA